MPFGTFEAWEPSGSSEAHVIETHYKRLPGNAHESIEMVIGMDDGANARNITTIAKSDAETIEVVYHDDVDAKVRRETNRGKDWRVTGTKVPTRVHTAIEDLLESYFGPGWLVARKSDKRDGGSHRQRFLIRRVSHTDFRYQTETYDDARKIIEGIDIEADTYGEMALYPQPPNAIQTEKVYTNDDTGPEKYPLDVYVAPTSTGTLHLLRGRDFRDTSTVDDVQCLCGRYVDAETIREGVVHHFADYVQVFRGSFPDNGFDEDFTLGDIKAVRPDYNAVQVLREDLCQSCGKAYCGVRRSSWDDTIRYYMTPNRYFEKLTHWTDGRVDDLDWTPIATEAQTDARLGGEGA